MRFPSIFRRRPEQRQQEPTTLEDSLQRTVPWGGPSDAGQNGMIAQSAAALYAGACADVKVEPKSARELITAEMLAKSAEAVILEGEALWTLRLSNQRPVLIPVTSAIVEGHLDPEQWIYTLTLSGPTSSETIRTRGADVVHLRWRENFATPWFGVSPATKQSATQRLVARIPARWLEMYLTAHGMILPVPTDDPATVTKITQTVSALRGNVLVGATMADGGGLGPSAAPPRDWTPQTYLPAPADTEIAVWQETIIRAFGEYGVPSSLIDRAASGRQARDALDEFLLLSVTPLLRRFESELKAKLEIPDLHLQSRAARRAEIQGRARATKALIDAGIHPQTAWDLTFEEEEVKITTPPKAAHLPAQMKRVK